MMDCTRELKITCDVQKSLNLNDLNILQGNLKEMTKKNYEKLKWNITEKGFSFPFFVWQDIKEMKTYILDGTHRFKVLKELEKEGFLIPKLPVHYIYAGTRKEAVEKLLSVTSQYAKITGQGLYELATKEDIDYFKPYDFSDLNLDKWEDEYFKETKEGLTECDAVPEVDKENVITKLGDIWILGEHRVMCGDSTKIEDVDKLMNGERADMVFTDPPYQLKTIGGGLFKNSESMKKIRENNLDNFEPSSLKMLSETCVYFHNRPLIKKYIELAENWNENYDIAIYHKKNVIPNYSGHMMTDVEYIAIIGKQDPNKGLEKSYYSKVYSGGKDKDNELSYSKPIEICEKFIKLYSEKTVLDIFLGSGSTLIACEKTNRKCYGMELDPYYCDVIVKRWEEFTGKKAYIEKNRNQH